MRSSSQYGRRARHRHSQHFEAGKRDARRMGGFREPRGIENVEPAGPAEAQAPIAQAMVGVIGEFLALQAMFAVIGLHRAGFGIEPHQPRVAAQPDPPLESLKRP